jgi:VCBS repeat-containing protein
MDENGGGTIPVLDVCTDVDDGDILTVGSVVVLGGGSASVVDNKVVWDPGTEFDHLAAGAFATVNVVYEVRDAWSATQATLPITVTGMNDTPQAVADTAATTENAAITIDVLANDTDVDDGHSFTLMSASAPTGTATVNANNEVEFTPGTSFDYLAQGETGSVTLTYTMADEHGAEAISTVDITITGTNDAPTGITFTPLDPGDVIPTSGVLGTFSTTDPDVGDSHTYRDIGSFLRVIADSLILDLGHSMVEIIDVESSDMAHAWVSKAFVVRFGTEASENITGGNLMDVIYAGGGADQSSGFDGDDWLFGQAGDDVLRGGNGDDCLVGGSGADTLYGGSGNDVFYFTAALGSSNIDTIRDFGPGDKIALSLATFGVLGIAGPLVAEHFTTESEIPFAKILYDSATGELKYDADAAGAGAPVTFATLTDAVGLHPTLSYSDFFWV